MIQSAGAMFISAVVLAGCGTSNSMATPCDGGECDVDAGDAGPADAGLDAGPALDLRFRGFGNALQMGGFVDGAEAVPDTFTLTSMSKGFSVADTNGGFFSRFFEFPLVEGPDYESQMIADGQKCPTSLASLMQQNLVITAIGGDPSLFNSDCALLGIGAPDGGFVYDYLSATVATLDDVSAALGANVEARSYVVTALSAPDSGIAYVAESIGVLPDGGRETYDTQIATATEAELDAEVGMLADAGYIITAANSVGNQPQGPAGRFIVVGTRPSGSTKVYSATAELVPPGLGGDGQADVQQHLAQGYAAMSYMDNVFGEPDGGFGGGFYIIWEK
jgi:hypothetical protein